MFLIAAAANCRAQNEGCITDKCHSTMGTKEWVHGPVGVGACTICHNRVEGKDHEFKFTMQKEELCFACHDEKRDMMLQSNVHTPVSEGNCIGCHDPHQSPYRFQLIGRGSELCFACHQKSKFEGEHVHGPVAAGDCNACHEPHASANPKQLRWAMSDLCFECHSDRSDIQVTRAAHPPVAERCTNCHQPHVSAAANMLDEPVPNLCLRCHQNLAESQQASHPHEPFRNGSCEECHNVHGSDQPMLFNAQMTEVCFECHEELGEYVSEQSFKHGPIRENDCVACHSPHGSENNRILKKPFPNDFYVPYQADNYAICFECHNREIALEERTETLTDFRDHDRNLHFVHVNKQEKGRSCRACHQVHASSQEKHIRKSVPYGKMDWELPVTYTKTESGGRCEVGCHSPKEYSRK